MPKNENQVDLVAIIDHVLDSITEQLRQITNNIDLIRDLIRTERPALQSEPTEPSKNPKTQSKSTEIKAKSRPESELGEIPNINDPDWPVAANPDIIVKPDSEEKKRFRALQISGLIPVPTIDKKVLDFGCGEKHTALELAHQAAKVVGYDIIKDDQWCNTDNVVFTTDRAVVDNNGPYDIILLHDVLDHIKGDDPAEIMKWIRTLLADNGVVFVRTHPWTSKHGGHLYLQQNKAFLHLVLTPDEMLKNNLKLDHNLRLCRPMAAYESWITNAGFHISDKRIQAEKPNRYFTGPILDRILKVTWDDKIDQDQALRIMSNDFIDYTLTT